METLDNCDTKIRTGKFGGTVEDECATYVLHPEDSDGDLACKIGGAGLGANKDDAMEIATDLCKAIDGKSVSPNAGFLNETRPGRGDSNLVLQIQYNPACPRGGGGTRAIDKDACAKFFGVLVNDCDTKNEAPFGKFGGNLTDECEVYGMGTNVLEEVRCVEPPIFGGTPHTVDPTTGQKAIDKYCKTKDSTLR